MNLYRWDGRVIRGKPTIYSNHSNHIYHYTSDGVIQVKSAISQLNHCKNKLLVQSVPKTTSPMPQSSKNWFEIVKIA
jgi:hypothetical protein